jgi:hypothetical protein
MTEPYDRLKAALADRYAIERELGSGGMATVYLAEDLKHERKVAIKVLRPELAAALGPERFLREIKVTAKLHHPHILELYDSGDAEGFLYYVMPYVGGESLRDRLNREKQLPVDEALQIAREVADALDSAHRHHVIHRDIKPENILLEEGHAVVADFGIARAVDVAGGTRLTETGIALGTPEYMSPEQAAGSGELDGRSDIYSLGCVLYEMLGGQPPFTGVTVESIVNQHMTATPAPVTQIRPAVSDEVVLTLSRMLAKAPADRYPTAKGSAEALALPSIAATSSGSRPPQAVARGNNVKLTIIGAAAAAAVAGIFFLLPPRGSALEPDRVVVAILQNETGDPQYDALGRMAQDWLTQGLLHTGIVQVVPTPTAQQASAFVQSAIAQGERLDPVQALAQETGAGTVVWGAIYRDADDLRFQLSVTDAHAGELIGALDPVIGPADSASSTIGVLREQLMGFLATRLDERLAGFAGAGGAAPTFEAYKEFSEGMDAYIRDDNAGAVPHFLRAYELDSSYVTSLLFAGKSLANLGRGAEADSMFGMLDAHRDRLSE